MLPEIDLTSKTKAAGMGSKSFRARIGRPMLAVLALAGAVVATAAAAASAAPSMSVDCDGDVAGVQSDCVYPVGSAFQADIRATEPPSAGYAGFDVAPSWLRGKLDFVSVKVAGVWPDCAFPATAGPGADSHDATKQRLAAGCAAGTGASPSHYAGPITELHMTCAEAGTSPIELEEGGGSSDYVTAALTSVVPSVANASVQCVGPDSPLFPRNLDMQLSARSSQHVRKRRGLIVYAKCSARCTLDVSGRVSISQKKRKAGKARKTYNFKSVQTTIAGDVRTKLELAASKGTLRALRRALKRHLRPIAIVNGSAKDLAGNQASAPWLKIRLKR